MMDLTGIKKLTIGGVGLKQLFINGIQVWKSGYKNWVPHSIDTDGSIYNGTGYKEGYRIRSGGAEAASNNVGSRAVCTGFIPFKMGDVLRISPPFSGLNTQNAINFADGSFSNLGQMTDVPSSYGICLSGAGWNKAVVTAGGVTTVDISGVSNGADVRYVRITHCFNDPSIDSSVQVSSGAELIVTVNEELI